MTRTLQVVMLLLGARWLLSRWLVVAVVYGHSMEPTVREGDYIFGIRVPSLPWVPVSAIRRVFIPRGAVVLLRPPAELHRLQLKRIVAVPGDFRSWGWGDSLKGPSAIPPAHVYVVGDASLHAMDVPHFLGGDSRYYGPCSYSSLVARAFLRYQPPWQFGYLGLVALEALEPADAALAGL